jgi:hypothetical protein
VEDVRADVRGRESSFVQVRAACRLSCQFETHVSAPNIEWEDPDNEPGSKPGATAMMHTVEDISELIDVADLDLMGNEMRT